MARKSNRRELKGDASPKLLEKALEALQPQYGDPWELKPTSVELVEKLELARIWFEFDAEHKLKDSQMGFVWSFYLCLPIYVFWGKKKQAKYFKEREK